MRLRVQRNKMNIFKRCTRSSGAILSKAQYVVIWYIILFRQKNTDRPYGKSHEFDGATVPQSGDTRKRGKRVCEREKRRAEVDKGGKWRCNGDEEEQPS